MKAAPVDKKEFKMWYYDPRRTGRDIAKHFRVARTSLDGIARNCGLLTRAQLKDRGIIFKRASPAKRNLALRRCDSCRDRVWCMANPHAPQLPCETEPTRHVKPERQFIYRSPFAGLSGGGDA